MLTPASGPSTDGPRLHRPWRRLNPARAAVGVVVVAALGSPLAGCGKPLMSPSESRSQFDRYDRSRNQYAPQYIEDEYGARTPNLRGRLAPKR